MCCLRIRREQNSLTSSCECNETYDCEFDKHMIEMLVFGKSLLLLPNEKVYGINEQTCMHRESLCKLHIISFFS